MVSGHGATHPGKVRRHNEDSMVVDERLGLFAVADGMGGHNAGEVASALALESVELFLTKSNEDHELTWPFGIESTLDYNGNRLRTAIKLANRRVFRESESRDQYTGMGTTIAVVLAEGPCASISGVGDSRIYLVRDGNIERLTQDHTWVETLIAQNPAISREALANHPMRHVLTKVIGGQDDIEVTITSRPLAAGDRLVICSDGVHGALDEARIAQIVRSAPDTKAAADRLVEEALDRDGEDNLTAVVAGVSE
jgi:serine/threonine protein phosphatase PrpC